MFIQQSESVKHSLRSPSSFIVVVLKSLMHRACICCGKPIASLEEASQHWKERWDGTYSYKPERVSKNDVKNRGYDEVK